MDEIQSRSWVIDRVILIENGINTIMLEYEWLTISQIVSLNKIHF